MSFDINNDGWYKPAYSHWTQDIHRDTLCVGVMLCLLSVCIPLFPFSIVSPQQKPPLQLQPLVFHVTHLKRAHMTHLRHQIWAESWCSCQRSHRSPPKKQKGGLSLSVGSQWVRIRLTWGSHVVCVCMCVYLNDLKLVSLSVCSIVSFSSHVSPHMSLHVCVFAICDDEPRL